MMKNHWLAFGEKRAWDKNELAYITEAPSIVRPNVTRKTATFNLPFISLGQVGDGKLMVIGNPHYNERPAVARTVTAGTGALIKMGSVRSTATRMT